MDARVAEIARMLGGDPESEVSRAHARELLHSAAVLATDAGSGASEGKRPRRKSAATGST